MDRLSSILPKVLHRRGFSVQAEAAVVTFQARAWIRTHLSHMGDVVHVRLFQEGQVIVECAHSIAVQEMREHTEALLTYLRQKCPLICIAGIRVARV